MATTEVIPPGSRIGILGAGQLGRMLAQAAFSLGYHVTVWQPDSTQGLLDPAMELATTRIRKKFDDSEAFEEFVGNVDVVLIEWENISVDLLKRLEARGVLVRPGSKVLAVAQERIMEKAMAWELGIPTADTIFMPRGEPAADEHLRYLPGRLKTNRNGYDGKGQRRVSTLAELATAIAELDQDCVLEKHVEFKAEVSVLIARNAQGEISVADMVQNTHENGILDTTVYPAYWHEPAMTRVARHKVAEAARKVASYLELEGILVLEFFVDQKNNVIFNEMAPRPHNSYHASIDVADTSQFEQLVRAACNLPLGKVTFFIPFFMQNLIGGTFEDWEQYLWKPHTHLHIYGKHETRKDRKMGHVTTAITQHL